MKKILLSFSLAALLTAKGFAQNIAVNNDGSQPHPSAMLDIKSNTKGLLIPRMTAAERTAIAVPAAGLLVFQTDGGKGFYYFDGNAWLPIASALQGLLNAWSLTGNGGTDSTVNFIGTTDSRPLIGKAGGIQMLKFSPDGRYNVSLGYNAGKNTTGSDNIAVGADALNKTTGEHNVAIGENTLLNNTAGSVNIGIGYRALYENTTGQSNIGIGQYTLNTNKTGTYNIALGDGAMQQSSGGSHNIAQGYNALVNNNGNNNIALGNQALQNNSFGNNNIAIGENADVINPLFSNCVAVGKNAKAGSANSIALGGAAGSGYEMKVGIGTSYPIGNLHIKQSSVTNPGIVLESSTGEFWRTYYWQGFYAFSINNVLKAWIDYYDGTYHQSSDLRLKKDTQAITNVLPRLLQLQAKTYRYKANPEGSRLSYGFIAQEVEPLFPEFVSTDKETGIKGIAYSNFGVIAVQAIKEQQQVISDQQKKIDRLEAGLQAIETKLGIR